MRMSIDKWHLENLPHDILLLIKLYLVGLELEDFFTLIKFNTFPLNQNEWLKLMETCHKFDLLKRKSRITVLSNNLKMYVKDLTFREKLHNCFFNIEKQIMFHICYYQWTNRQHFYFTTETIDDTFVHKLKKCNDSEVLFRESLQFLNLSKLHITNCDYIRTLQNLPLLTYLKISGCFTLEVIDIVPLLSKIYINTCENLSILQLESPIILDLYVANCPNVNISQYFSKTKNLIASDKFMTSSELMKLKPTLKIVDITINETPLLTSFIRGNLTVLFLSGLNVKQTVIENLPCLQSLFCMAYRNLL